MNVHGALPGQPPDLPLDRRSDRSGDLHALILTPHGRDGQIAGELIGQAGIASHLCRDLAELVAAAAPDVAFVLLAEEAVRTADLRALSEWIAGQPPWSDLPFILLTDHGGGPERNPAGRRWLEMLGNVTFIERPFHPTTLVSVARVALKGRRRQFETRGLLGQLREGETRLRTALRAGKLRTWELDLVRPGLDPAAEPAGPARGRTAVTVAGAEAVLGPIHPDDREQAVERLRRSLRTGEDYAMEFRTFAADGAVHWLDVRARVVRDAAGRGQRLVGLSSDITARKADEEALLQLKDQLERRVEERTAELRRANTELVMQIAERERSEDQLRHMQKLESIGELTGGVAHDFNNLLTAVLGNLELLKKRLPGDPVSDRLLDGAVQGAERGAALTQRLLAFARRQPLAPAAIDLAALVRGVTDLLRRSLGPAIEIRFELPASLPPAHADANQVEMALLNLAVNARDAMPGGGTLAIALDAVDRDAAPDLAAGRYLRLTVSDSGAGMDADTLRRAIEPFFSTKEIGKGTGLGLSMIHGLALQLHGALRLSSEPGRGTVAELLLPVAQGTVAAKAPSRAAPRPAPPRRKARLLYVDDDFLIALSTVALLEDLGHQVVHAGSGRAALDVLRQGKDVDLLITDYAMPGMTGTQLAEEARKLRPNLPVLLATGFADLPAGSGPDLPRLNKPYRQGELAQHIAQLIG